MRYLVGFICVLALGVMPVVGCAETEGTGGGGMGGVGDGGSAGVAGGGGAGGMAGNGGAGGMSGTGGSAGTGGVAGSGGAAGSGGSGAAGGMAGTGGSAGDGGTGGSIGNMFPCTEQGIRDAIAEGGGPQTFACGDGMTVVTAREITIDNDVILDGEGNLTLDGNDDHSVFTVYPGVTAELRGCAVTNGFQGRHPCSGPACGPCSGGSEGGGIANAGTLIVTDSAVSGNRGPGIGNTGTLIVTASAVSGNGGPGIGNVGICDPDSVVTVTDSTVSGNLGGGIGTWLSEIALTMTNSSVSGNGGDGINSRTLTMTNSTVSWNSAAGIVAGAATVTSSTLSGNGDWAFAYSAESLAFANSIISGDCFPVSNVISNGYNIESPGNTCGFNQGTDQVNVGADDLNLGPLQDNGGPTMTHAITTESAAFQVIPEAVCEVDEDQRGVSRPQGDACDVGAFELEYSRPGA